MNEHASENKTDIICHCSGTTKQQIAALVKNGADTLEEISSRTGAAAGCGGCETWIIEMLDDLEYPNKV